MLCMPRSGTRQMLGKFSISHLVTSGKNKECHHYTFYCPSPPECLTYCLSNPRDASTYLAIRTLTVRFYNS